MREESLTRAALLLAVLFAVAAPAQGVAGAPDLLNGAWVRTELVSVDRGRLGDGEAWCLRLWLERRTYTFEVSGAWAEGVYGNELRTVPLGTLGIHPDCRFAPPARDPLTHHNRTWSLSAKHDGARWKVTAGTPNSLGPLHLETLPFSTSLRLEDGRLVDLREDGPMAFSRPGEPPAAAREALERAIEQLHTGRCVAVHRQLEMTVATAAKVDEICNLLQRSRRFSGRYLAIEVTRAEPVDAVAWGFPGPTTEMRVDRSAVVFDYTIVFEHEELFGTAVVWRREGEWRLAAIW